MNTPLLLPLLKLRPSRLSVMLPWTQAPPRLPPRHSLTYATARHRCEQCQSPDACREWLKTAPEALNFAPEFCPNGDILFELQFDQPGPREFEVKKPPAPDEPE
jgi:hypothetical protein